MRHLKTYACLLTAASLLSSCAKKGWSVEGSIANAPADAKVAIEGFNGGSWYCIDSVAVASDGTFAYNAEEGSPYPDIYRVSLNGRSIYFPIDSLEVITITADGFNFDKGYTMEGLTMAQDMMNVDKRVADIVAAKGPEAALADSLLKRDLGTMVNDDPSGLLGYYIVNKTVDGQPLFSPANRSDLRIIGALANKWSTQKPNDPRTQYLRALFLQARAAINPESRPSMEATVTGLIDIELFDAKGQKRKLADLVKGSGITLLSFTSYQSELSLAYNAELNRLMDLYKDKNLNVYQVSVDPDEVQWRTIANNLPWTAVWYDNADDGRILNIYNVQAVPMTYIIDGHGDLVERIIDPSELESAVKKHL